MDSANATREANGASPASDRPRQLVSYAADGDTSADSDMDASAVEDELEKRLDSKDKSTPMEESPAAQSPAISSTKPDPLSKDDAAATAAAPSPEVAKSSSSSGSVVVSKPPTLFPSAVAAAAAAPAAATAAGAPSDDPLQAFYSELATVDTEFSSDIAQSVAAPLPPARSCAPLPAASAAPAVPAAKHVTNDSVPTAAASAASSSETQPIKATTANLKVVVLCSPDFFTLYL